MCFVPRPCLVSIFRKTDFGAKFGIFVRSYLHCYHTHFSHSWLFKKLDLLLEKINKRTLRKHLLSQDRTKILKETFYVCYDNGVMHNFRIFIPTRLQYLIYNWNSHFIILDYSRTINLFFFYSKNLQSYAQNKRTCGVFFSKKE